MCKRQQFHEASPEEVEPVPQEVPTQSWISTPLSTGWFSLPLPYLRLK